MRRYSEISKFYTLLYCIYYIPHIKELYGASAPDEKYIGDITYIHTSEDWLYFATVIDLYSKKVVSCSMDDMCPLRVYHESFTYK